MNISIREIEPSDYEEIMKIYNDTLDERIATFNIEHIDIDKVRKWKEDGIVLVAESKDSVIGFVRSYPYSARSCYSGIAEFSI